MNRNEYIHVIGQLHINEQSYFGITPLRLAPLYDMNEYYHYLLHIMFLKISTVLPSPIVFFLLLMFILFRSQILFLWIALSLHLIFGLPFVDQRVLKDHFYSFLSQRFNSLLSSSTSMITSSPC